MIGVKKIFFGASLLFVLFSGLLSSFAAADVAPGYVKWDTAYELWMPIAYARTASAVYAAQPRALPFEEPKMQFSAPVVMRRVEFDGARAFLADMPFFYESSPVANTNKLIEISGVKTKLPKIQVGTLPEKILVFKQGSQITTLGYEGELPEELEQAINQSASKVPDGLHEVIVKRE
jgi:hypothetical protein